MAKIHTSTDINDIIDLSLQCCGGNGIGKDLPIAYFYEDASPFCIVDGTDEVHRRSIARWAFEDVDDTKIETTHDVDEGPRIDALDGESVSNGS